MHITDERRQEIRSYFPALSSSTAFLENAGGSQVPSTVIDGVRDYMLNYYVQVGAGYRISIRATEIVDEAHDLMRLLLNGDKGEVILGSSTSALLRTLSDAYARVLSPGQEIVVAETGHEANIGPWKHLQERGIRLRWWKMDPSSFECSQESLEKLLNHRTALVAFPHVSNLLGEIVDVNAITRMAHASGARVVVDGVAYAPHRAMDVDSWDVDWYAFSTYKVYGPHMAALWGRKDAWEELEGPNHFFIPSHDVPYKWELGSVSHEGCSGLLGLQDYLKVLAEVPQDAALDRPAVERAFEIMTECELPLQTTLVDYLRSRSDVQIVGPAHGGTSRVGTVSFVHESLSSREITRVFDGSEVAIRHGHMYAYHLCEALRLDPEDGVVRISLVHYNTPEEIDRVVEILERALA